MKLKISNEIFYNPAFNGAIVGNKIKIGASEINDGNVLMLKNIPAGTHIYNLEINLEMEEK